MRQNGQVKFSLGYQGSLLIILNIQKRPDSISGKQKLDHVINKALIFIYVIN